MATVTHSAPERQRSAQEAAAWLSRLEQDDSLQCRSEFVVWLKSSSLHIEEFLFLTATARELDRVQLNTRESVEELIRSAAGTVVPISDDLPLHEEATPVRKRWRPVRLLAAAAAIAALALGATFFWRQTSDQYYETAMGEQRAVRLDDGSIIQLNTQTRVNVDYTENERNVHLLAGEALFVVQHDPSRPFRVLTDTAVVRAIGTQFNVYRRENQTTVSVVEGRVEVTTGLPRPTEGRQASGSAEQEAPAPAALQVQRTELGKGEQVRITTDGNLIKVAEPDVARTVAWRERRLVFKSNTVAEILEQFNRYNPLPMQVEDASLSGIELSGVFSADDPESFLTFLQQYHDVEIERSADRIVIRARRPAVAPAGAH